MDPSAFPELTRAEEQVMQVLWRLGPAFVKDVLADPKKVYPGYDSKDGYEVAGFIWFQGFNDLVGSYPGDPNKKGSKDYTEYSRLLACLIRDLRKELNTPKMPFVTGVLGVGGETTGDGTESFRNAMAAPGEREEFKGTVANVYTHKFWPADIDAIKAKKATCKQRIIKFYAVYCISFTFYLGIKTVQID